MLQPPGASRERTVQPGRRKAQESPDEIVRKLQRLPANKKCCDCSSKLPSCVNLAVGSFVCITCGGIHRELNQRVKGVGHSSFTAEEADLLLVTDNDKVNAIYLAGFVQRNERLMQPTDNSDLNLLRSWITRKYRDRAWYREPANGQQAPNSNTNIQPTVAHIPPKQSANVDLFGGFGTGPSNQQWDAFGAQPDKSPQPTFQANFADFGNQQQQQQQRPPNPPNTDFFPADFGSSQLKQQMVHPPTANQEVSFKADFGSFAPQQPASHQQQFANSSQQPPVTSAAVFPMQSQQQSAQETMQHTQMQQPNLQGQNMQFQNVPPQHMQSQQMHSQQMVQPHSMPSQQMMPPSQQMMPSQQLQPQQMMPSQQLQPQQMGQPMQSHQLMQQPQVHSQHVVQPQTMPSQQLMPPQSMMQMQPQQMQPQQMQMQPQQMQPQQIQPQQIQPLQQSSLPSAVNQQAVPQQQGNSQMNNVAHSQLNTPTTQMPSYPPATNQQPANPGQMNFPHLAAQMPSSSMLQPQFPNTGQAFSQTPQGQTDAFAQFTQPQGLHSAPSNQVANSSPSPVPSGKQNLANHHLAQQQQSQQASFQVQQHGFTDLQAPNSNAPPIQSTEIPLSMAGHQAPTIQPNNGPGQFTAQPPTQFSPQKTTQDVITDPFAALSTQQQPVEPNQPVVNHTVNEVQSIATGKEGTSVSAYAESQSLTSPARAPENFSVQSSTEKARSNSKFKQGQKVYYKSASYCGNAEILKVHLDDELQPFYTINVLGKEKQTDDGHLCDESPLLAEVKLLIGSLTDQQLLQVKEFVTRQVSGHIDSTNGTSSIAAIAVPASSNPINPEQASVQNISMQPNSTLGNGNAAMTGSTSIQSHAPYQSGNINVGNKSQGQSPFATESNHMPSVVASPNEMSSTAMNVPGQASQPITLSSQDNSSFAGIPSPTSMKGALPQVQMSGMDLAPLSNKNDTLLQNINQVPQQFHQNVPSNLSYEMNPMQHASNLVSGQQHQQQNNPNQQMQSNPSHTVTPQPQSPAGNPFDLF